MRTEAQKRADDKYQIEKFKKYKTFSCVFRNEEWEEINAKLKEKGMSRTEFIRQSIKNLEEK